MQIDYDPQADTMYIRLHPGEVDDTIQVSKYIYVDVDSEEKPIGIEILFASRVLDSTDLTSITLTIARPLAMSGSQTSSTV
jgi:uncharacterized protein YuzE